ncbi:MAG: hypothetical protein KC766_12920 [Myxococcales bacterium]|nr:hypothetical protein [Myxococcales bacterium]
MAEHHPPSSSLTVSPTANRRAARQLELHAAALEQLKAGRYAAARVPLSRLLLTLEPSHPGRPGCLATLAFVFAQLGRLEEASQAARQALVLAPDLEVARAFLLAG